MQAQTGSLIKERTTVISKENYKDFLYADIGGMLFLDVWKTPVLEYSTNGTRLFPEYRSFLSVIKLSTDLRVDLIQYYDIVSASLSFPLSFGLGMDINSLDDGAVFQTPVYFQLNFMRNSTKEYIDPFGFSIGIGYHRFSYFGRYDNFEDDPTFVSDDPPKLKNHGMLAARISVNMASWSMTDGHRLDFFYGLQPDDLHPVRIDDKANTYWGLSYFYSIY